MRSNLRRIVSTTAAYLVCVTIVLASMTAVAGVNRWTAIGPDGTNVVALVIEPLMLSVPAVRVVGPV